MENYVISKGGAVDSLTQSLRGVHLTQSHSTASKRSREISHVPDGYDEIDGTVTDAVPAHFNLNLREDSLKLQHIEVQQPKQPLRLMTSADYSSELFDVLMIYADKDFDLVYKLYLILERFVQLANLRKPSICLDLLDVGDPSSEGNKLDFFEIAAARSSCAFLFFGDQGEEQPPGAGGDEAAEGWTKFQQDKLLMDTITKKGIFVVPIKMRVKSRVPDRFSLYRAIELSQLLKGKHLDEIKDVAKLTSADIDQRMVTNISRILNSGRSQKLVMSQSLKYRMSVDSRPVDTSLNKLSSNQILIQKNYHFLTENVDIASGILGQLFSVGVLDRRELETVRTSGTCFESMERLLDLLFRKSPADLQKFIQALRASGQSHIAVVLERTK